MRLRSIVLSVSLLLSVSVSGFGKDLTKLLPPRYREWVNRDVAYIISDEEKQTFLHLTSDTERDNFIDHFWEIRNPTPGSPTNPYKQEHYRRLQYAIDHFSTAGNEDGWQTDMGRIYITLGPPAQKARYVSQSGVRGMEIWFYSSSHPALPPFFSIIFYEKDFGDFRLYSPFLDGPQKLVTGIQAEQGRVQSVLQIDHLLGREVALNTLSLIPGEPVNLNDADSTMRSDMMLDTIKNLANNPFTLDELRMRRALNESVTHRVVLPNDLLSVICVPLRDAEGNIRLHYALRLTQPQDFAVAQADQRYYYSLEASVRVLTPEGKEIIRREHKVSQYLSQKDLDLEKGKPVVYEGWLPAAPGKYKIEFTLTNLLTRTAFTGEREITIPEIGPQDFSVTQPVAFSQAMTADPARADSLPFTAGGVRFRPYVAHDLALVPGQDLKFFYQVWRAPEARHETPGGMFLADYAYGRPNFAGSVQTIHDELPENQFDAYGSVINGKKIATTDLPTGDYRLSITVTNAQTRQKQFSSMRFNIVSNDPSSSESWWIDDDGLASYLASGQADYDRGLMYLSGKDARDAVHSFREALAKNPHDELARNRLIAQYFNQQDFVRVVELFSRTSVTAKTDEGTILTVADSMDRTGNPESAVSLLESALHVKPPSGPLYLALASYYQHLGNNAKAEAMEQRGRALMVQENHSN
jgi:GWxTD domain-containing protein